MTFSTFSKGVALAFAVGVAVAWSGGCSGSNNNGNAAGPVGPGGADGTGICLSSCDKSCNVDNDCNTNMGELCCDYGSGGKVCQSAASCPIFCSSDTKCDTTMGKACVERSLVSGAEK